MRKAASSLRNIPFPQKKSAGWAFSLLALSSALFAVMALCVKLSNGALSPGQLVVFRFGVGLMMTVGVFVVRRKGPMVERWPLLILRGLLGGGAVYTYFVAIEKLGVGPATLLNYSAPIYAAVFSAFFLKEKVSRTLAFGIFLATVGSMLVASSTSPPGRPLLLGIGALSGLLSAVLSGAAMTTIRALREDTDAFTVFFSFCLVGGLFALPMAALDFRPLTAHALGLALAVGVISFFAQLLFTYAFGFVTASVGSATLQLTPLFSWGLAIVFLREPVRLLTAMGALLCMVGILVGMGILSFKRKTTK
jgi:drug/metabolite transporter (DMT)-like permease